MKLKELFANYDDRRLVRRSSWEYWQSSVTISSLKDIRKWLEAEEGRQGAMIAPHYIEDNNSDDWNIIL